MNQKIQMLIAGALLLVALLFKAFGGKEAATNKEDQQETAKDSAPDLVEKSKIMSEMGKKGAAKSAEVRRAKKAAREAAKNEFSS